MIRAPTRATSISRDVISPHPPCRTRAPLLATVSLLALTLAVAPASAATRVVPTHGGTSSLTEVLRKLRERSAAAKAGATTPTTTYAPSGGTAAPPTTTPQATTPAPTATHPATTTPATPAAPATTSKAKAGRARRLSTGAIVLVTLAALLVLGSLAWAIARSRAYEPPWLLTMRHATAEAGFRASATWSELLDWARLGR